MDQRGYTGPMLHLVPNLAALVLIMSVGLTLVACSKKPPVGDTTFARERKGFEKELTPDQRKATIKQLQTETTSKP
jgi:hypothetical protein